MATEPQNSPFIKNLASSDKKTRDQALSSLRTYLSNRASIPTLDLLKLWKGLFYCLWMQDKPLHQQRLARDLASLVDILHADVVLPFLDCFWKTMAREWVNIEALRMDKYLFLIRQELNASWRYLSRNRWGDKEKVEKYMRILEETPLNAVDVKIPNGLRYHVLDIYVDELEKVGGDGWDLETLEVLLEPVRKLQEESKTKAVRKAAKEVLEDARLKKWRGEEVEKKDEDAEMAEDGADEEWGGIED
ncbi:uncharacterized protein EI97DRAFT_433603 [Westerdykella ornata]|uniref:Nucleolar protein NOP52 variant n=1 Tax=Westerdykella ornata TaxID=318751 RepID=A0A6A6JMP5_WESOR|nr:uncharacterized protein EI97DRAFT_433603 [Westerdykella ornata]KAF2276199.1 hypothetical protein EI97DRAFT_433603 [Westerdykella ornata]